jgi:hypothetical protein
MDRQGILAFLDALDAQDVYDNGGEWIRCSCLLAPWLHKDGVNLSRAFAIKVDDSGPSVFYCFSCQKSGWLTKLLHSLYVGSGDYPIEAAGVLWEAENFEFDVTDVSRLVSPYLGSLESRYRDDVLVPEHVLARYPLLGTLREFVAEPVMAWLVESRGVSVGTALQYQIRFGLSGGSAPILVFPVLNRRLEVVDMYARELVEKRFYRLNAAITDSTVDYKASHLTFGNHLLRQDKAIWITEGAIDAMRLHTIGITNVCACLGTPRISQLQNLYSRKGYVLAFDADDAGRKMARAAMNILTGPVWVVDWGVLGVKDPGDLRDGTPQELLESLNALGGIKHG